MKTKRFFTVLAVLMAVTLIVTSTALAYGPLHSQPKVKILVQGAPVHGANGLYFGPDGNLYIASAVGNEIVVMNPQNGAILRRIGPQEGVAAPDDLFVAADGSIYWTAIMIGNVFKQAPDGTQTLIASGLPGVNPITFSDDGRLFVARDFWGTGLYEIDPTGVNPPRVILPDLVNLNGFDFGPDGWLYGPIFGVNIVRINVDTAEMQPVADFAGAAVKFDSQGRLHSVSYGTGEVVRIDITSGAVEVIARYRQGLLDNLAFSADDRLFVSGATDGAILEVKPHGRLRVVSPGGLIMPAGVAVKADSAFRGRIVFDRVFVADLWTLRQYEGKVGFPLGKVTMGMGSEMIQAMTIAPDGENWVISSWLGNAVQVWNAGLDTVLESYAVPNMPMNAIRFQGDLLVAELMTGQVVRLNAAGSTPLAQFYIPTGMAATEDDLWVADYAAGVVYQVVADGVTLAQPAPVAGGLAGPEGLALDNAGKLLVVESAAGRLSQIDPATGEVSVVAEGLLFMPPPPNNVPTAFFNGVAVGPSGVIYVTGDQTDVLYRIQIKK